MEKETLSAFLRYLQQCRPVWTLSWRDSVAPSLRSGVPEVREEDVFFNRQLADKYILEFPRKTLVNRLAILEKYLQSTTGIVVYRVKTMSGYCHKVQCSEKQAGSYFLSCILYEKRHNHTLKYM